MGDYLEHGQGHPYSVGRGDEQCERILMVGIWGAGKTTIGTLLAQELNWHIQDADTITDSFVESVLTGDIEALEERSRRIRAILEDETVGGIIIPTTMRPLLDKDGQIPPSTDSFLSSSRCLVVEIQRNPHEIAKFLHKNPHEKAKRPHLRGNSVAETAIDLTGLEQTLRPLYDKYRNCVVPHSNIRPEEKVATLLKELAKFGISAYRDDEFV